MILGILWFMECLERKASRPTLTMKPNPIQTKLALFAVLFLATAFIFFACANKRTDTDEPLKNLVADSGQNADSPLDNPELSEDIIISIEKPDIMGGDDDDNEAEGDDSSADGVPPSDEDENDMNDFEGSGTDIDDEKGDSGSSDASTSTEPNEELSDDEKEEESDETVEDDEKNEIVPGAGYAMYDVPLTIEQQLFIIETAEKFGIPPELMFGVMHVETRYTVTAVSKNGKYIGMMQIAKSNLAMLNRKFGITDLHDFEQNVTAGAYFLSYFFKKYDGDINKTLMCYHCGEGGAKKCWRNGYFSDSYCRKVRKEMDRIFTEFEPAQVSGKVSG